MIKRIISNEPTQDNLQQTLEALKGLTGWDKEAKVLWICGKAVQLMDPQPEPPEFK